MCSIAGNAVLCRWRTLRCPFCRAAPSRQGLALRIVLARLCRLWHGRASACSVACVRAGSVRRIFVGLSEGRRSLRPVWHDVGCGRSHLGTDDPLPRYRSRTCHRLRHLLVRRDACSADSVWPCRRPRERRPCRAYARRRRGDACGHCVCRRGGASQEPRTDRRGGAKGRCGV